MRRLRLGAAAIAAAVLVGTWTAAGATAKPAPTTTHLQTEINGLQRTVKALQRQLGSEQSRIGGVASTASSATRGLATLDGTVQGLEGSYSSLSTIVGQVQSTANDADDSVACITLHAWGAPATEFQEEIATC